MGRMVVIGFAIDDKDVPKGIELHSTSSSLERSAKQSFSDYEQYQKEHMGKITINGVTYTGNNIKVIQNRVIIDGKDVTPDVKEITITVTGNVNSINVDFAKEVHVKGLLTVHKILNKVIHSYLNYHKKYFYLFEFSPFSIYLYIE